MDSVARSSVAAAAATLVAGGILGIAAVPPVAQARDVALTAGLAELADQQLSFNSDLVRTMLGANAGLAHGQEAFFDRMIAGLPQQDQDAAGTAMRHLHESYNMSMGASQGALLGALGARVIDPQTGAVLDPTALNASLLFPSAPDAHPEIGGLEGVTWHGLAGLAALARLTPGASADPGRLDDIDGKLAEMLDKFDTLNGTLVDAEKVFNTDLLASELAMQRAVFGTDSALNGAVDRAINSFNMLLDAQQQGLNGFVGVTGYDPQELTLLLLTGSDAQIFNDGAIGGIQGALDQNLAMLADLGGLQAGDFHGLFDHFDAAAFTAASQDFIGLVLAGPFGAL